MMPVSEPYPAGLGDHQPSRGRSLCGMSNPWKSEEGGNGRRNHAKCGSAWTRINL